MSANINVFISYARKDGLKHAEEIEETLKHYGIKTWRDKRDLDPFEDFTAEIETAIESASHVIVCITPESKNKESFVRREIQYALMMNKPIIPIRFANIPPHIHISTQTWLDCSKENQWDNMIVQLLRQLNAPIAPDILYQRVEDPFHEHVQMLLQFSVEQLQVRVLNVFGVQDMLRLSAFDTPDAVRKKNMPLVYQTHTPSWLTGNTSKPEKKLFQNFKDAFEYYNKRLLILGEPGAGKTVTLLSLMRDAAYARLDNPEALLPVYAPINTWQRSMTILQWLSSVTELPMEKLEELVAQRKVLLILDGLDELPEFGLESGYSQRHRRRFLSILKELGTVPTIITCRTSDYDEIVFDNEKISLEGAVTLGKLTNEQIQIYLTGQQDLWEAIQNDPALLEMARIPLLLTLLAITYQGMGEKAAELKNLSGSPGELRYQIFNSYVQRRYAFEQQKSTAQLKFTLEDIYKGLGIIAADLVDRSRGQSSFTIENITKILGVDETIANSFAEEICQLHLGVTFDRKNVQFMHLLLRDHFALSYGLQILQTSRSPQNRADAVQLLVHLGDDIAIPYLAKTLTEGSELVLQSSILALGRMRNRKALDVLLDFVAENPDRLQWGMLDHYHDDAVRNVGMHYPDYLLSQLRHPSKHVKDKAGSALLNGLINEQMIEPLLKMMGDENSDTRWWAARLLGGSNKTSFDQLLTLIESDNPLTKASAVTALGFTKDKKAIVHVLPLLNSAHPEVRRSAALVMGELEVSESISTLITLLDDEVEDVCAAAARSLGLLRAKEALEPMLNTVKRISQKHQYELYSSLSRLGYKDEKGTEIINTVLQTTGSS